MSHLRLPSDPFACLRALACAAALSCAAMTLATLAPPYALAQDQEGTEDAPAEEAPAEETPDEEMAPDEAAPEEAAPEEAAPAPEEAAPEEAAPETAAPEEAAPAAGWNIAKPCENYQHPYEADLCQQWRTAEAAEKTATASEHNVALTRLLMLIGALATALLLLMFIPLFMAAFGARRAARGGSSLPAVAARDDVDRAEELRAYVDVDKLEFIETPESEGIVKVKVVLRNSGQTPAFRVRSAANVGIRDVADEDMVPIMPMPDNRSAGAARPRLGRDATHTEIVDCDSTPSLADRVMNGDATIVVWGWTEYYDVFDRKQRTVFQYLCNAGTLESGQIFKPMSRGDEVG